MLRTAASGDIANAFDQLEAIDLRHAEIHHQHMRLHLGERSSAVSGELNVLTSAPAVSSTTRSSVSASSSSSIASTRTPVRSPRPVNASRRSVRGCSRRAPAGLGMHDHQRQPDAEGGAFPFAGAGGLDGAAVHFDDVPHDREAEAETAGFSRRPAVRLAKTFEDVGQEIRPDARRRCR